MLSPIRDEKGASSDPAPIRHSHTTPTRRNCRQSDYIFEKVSLLSRTSVILRRTIQLTSDCAASATLQTSK